MHNMGLRAGNTIRIPVQRNRHIGPIVQPTAASITRFPQFMPARRREVVNLVDEEDARELGMRGRNNNRYPLQLDQRMIHDNTGVYLYYLEAPLTSPVRFILCVGYCTFYMDDESLSSSISIPVTLFMEIHIVHFQLASAAFARAAAPTPCYSRGHG